MATAVETQPQSGKVAAPALGLLPASLAGAALFVASFVVVGYGVSRLTADLAPAARGVLASLAVIVAVVLTCRVIGANGPRGSVGGAFLTFVCAAVTFVLGRAVGLWMEGTGFVGQVFAALVVAGLIFGSYRLLTGARGRRWMLALESQGWFSAFAYKRTQGLRVRKWTMIGLLLIGGSGVYAVVHQGMLPAGDWNPRLPFTDVRVPVLADVVYSAPILLVALSIWFAWRTVNVPPFADFLIATEAEMNKVSWTPLRKLIRDTVVVLVFTALLTAFLLTVDLFWGWTLSHPWLGVLPEKSTQGQADPTGQKAEW